MRIAFVTPEAFPFVKTGGLADVSYSLPGALSKRGHDVRLVLPRYYRVDKSRFNLTAAGSPLGVPFGSGEKWAALFRSHFIPGVETCFIEHDEYYGRDRIYDDGYTAYSDNAERFVFFSRAVMQALKAIGFAPDIIHCNDWQTGLVPVLRRELYGADPFYRKTATVFTVHNVGYQGVFDRSALSLAQLGGHVFVEEGLEFFGQVNFLKAGVNYADMVTTVSRRYALEIQREEFGYNLAGVFRKAAPRLAGVTNGVDFDKWNPATDTFIPARYSEHDLTGKSFCKGNLQREMGITLDPDVPLIGIITRLTHQKGVDVLADALEMLFAKRRCQFVILGSGEDWLVQRYQDLQRRYPERVGVYWGYDERLSHLFEAGLDIFVMPSRYEPCGLNQMYSMKYGTIPVVRSTGGLDDTVTAWDGTEGTGNGFKFDDLTPEAVAIVLAGVLDAYGDRRAWRRLQRNAMAFNYSWDDAVREYEEVYRRALDGVGAARTDGRQNT